MHNPLAFLLLSLVPLLWRPNRSAAVFGYTNFAAQGKIEAEFSLSRRPVGRPALKTSRRAHLASTLKIAKPPITLPRSFARLGSIPRSFPTAYSSISPKSSAPRPLTLPAISSCPAPPRARPGDPYQTIPLVMPSTALRVWRCDRDVVYANYGASRTLTCLPPAHRPARQDCHLPLRRQLSRRQGLHRPAAWRRRRAHLLRPQDDGYFKGDAYPNGPGVRYRRPARIGTISLPVSGDPETPALRPRWTCPTPPDFAGRQPAHIISIPSAITMPRHPEGP